METGLASQDAVGRLIEMLATDSYPNVEINRNLPWMWKLVGTSTKGALAHLIASEEESWS